MKHRRACVTLWYVAAGWIIAVVPQALEPFYGPPRGFSFSREIQPILDRHCTGCHNDRQKKMSPDRLARAVTR
jgi:hypothetical protein